MSPNSSLYRFSFPDPTAVSGLTVASCLVTQAPAGKEGAAVVRPYTPVSFPREAQGHLDMVIKTYPTGAMSSYIDRLSLGEQLAFKGPFVKLSVTKNMKRSIGLVAGGTGITPMLQVIEHVLRLPGDVTALSLVFANKSPDDILLKSRLDQLTSAHPSGRFRVHYVVDAAPPGWSGGSIGFVTAELLRATMPAAGSGADADDVMVMVCGPPGMMAAVSGDKAPDKSQGSLSGALRTLGYKPEQVFKF